MRVEEGWWLLTSIIDCPLERLAEGLPLEVVFHPAGPDVWLPYARPAGPGP
jgi:hypothetical protein